jgi:hypothetical protein
MLFDNDAYRLILCSRPWIDSHTIDTATYRLRWANNGGVWVTLVIRDGSDEELQMASAADSRAEVEVVAVPK